MRATVGGDATVSAPVGGGRGCARTGRCTTMPAREGLDRAMAARYDPAAPPGRPPANLWTTAPATVLQGSMIVWKSYGSRRNPMRSYMATAGVLKSLTYSDRLGWRSKASAQQADMAVAPTPRPRRSGGT